MLVRVRGVICTPSSQISSKYKFETIVIGAGKIQFYDLLIKHDKIESMKFCGDEALEALQLLLLTKVHRKNLNDQFKDVELFSFSQLNLSVGCIESGAILFCSFSNTYLQQRRVLLMVRGKIMKSTLLGRLNKVLCTILFQRPSSKVGFELCILVL